MTIPATGVNLPKEKLSPGIQVAHLHIRGAALPSIFNTLPVAEAARYCLMGIYGRLTMRNGVKGKSVIFSGKRADGALLRTHGHCHFLPVDKDGDGHLDHLILYAMDGFGTNEVRSIIELSRIESRRDTAPAIRLDVELGGMGSPPEFTPGLLKSSHRWLSATPFLAPDHPKTRGRWYDTERGGADPVRFLLAQVRKEITRWIKRNALDISPDSVEVTPLLDGAGDFRRFDQAAGVLQESMLHFKRTRQKHGDDGGRRLAGFFQLTFPRSVSGPLCLGYSSHFGMGLFVPKG